MGSKADTRRNQVATLPATPPAAPAPTGPCVCWLQSGPTRVWSVMTANQDHADQADASAATTDCKTCNRKVYVWAV